MYLVDDLLTEEECEGLRFVHDQMVEQMLSVADPFICFDTYETLEYHLRELNHTLKGSKKHFVPSQY